MSTSGGYHEYNGGCSVHRGDIMIHVGEQGDKSLSSYIENPDVLNISRCTHDIPHMHYDILRCTQRIPPMYLWYPPMYSWYPPMYSWYPPMYLRYPPDVLMVSPDVLMVSPDVLMVSPDVLMVSPDVLMVSPDVPNIPRCTEHPSMYRTHIIQGEGHHDHIFGRSRIAPFAFGFLIKESSVLNLPKLFL